MDTLPADAKLKLNQDKTELLVISSKYRPRPPLAGLYTSRRRSNEV